MKVTAGALLGEGPFRPGWLDRAGNREHCCKGVCEHCSFPDESGSLLRGWIDLAIDLANDLDGAAGQN